jgi:hypothetical protein
MPVANTYVLEGLIQGVLPADAAAGSALQSLAAELRKNNLDLALEIDGGQFSFLADARVHDCQDFQPLSVITCVSQAVEKLLATLPPAERSSIVSTPTGKRAASALLRSPTWLPANASERYASHGASSREAAAAPATLGVLGRVSGVANPHTGGPLKIFRLAWAARQSRYSRTHPSTRW